MIHELAQEVDLVSVILGLLINLAEASRSCCQQLLQVRSPAAHRTSAACDNQMHAASQHVSRSKHSIHSQQGLDLSEADTNAALLPLLCQLTQVGQIAHQYN